MEAFPTPKLEQETLLENTDHNRESLEDVLEDRSIDLPKKEFSLEERNRIYDMVQQQLKKSTERFRQEENFVTEEQINEVFKGNMEEVQQSIERIDAESRIEALKAKVLLSPEELEKSLAGIERDRLAPSASQIVKNMEKVYKAYERSPRKNVSVTPRSGINGM